MKKLNTKGFILHEILIGLALLIILFVSVRGIVLGEFFLGNQAIRNTYTDIDFSIQSTLRNATSGYGESLVVRSGERNNRNLLPEDYIIFFQSSNENTMVGGVYYYIQTQTRKIGGNSYTRVINRDEIEVSSPAIYLKRIVGKTQLTDIGYELNSIAISFKNSLSAKMEFYINDTEFLLNGTPIIMDDTTNTINEFPQKVPNNSYNIIELEFYGNDDNKKFTYRIFRDKQFYTILE